MTSRFGTNGERNPGPGSYTHDPRVKWGKTTAKPREQRKGTVQWVRVTGAPSIPSATQSYGYEENKEGDLILQKAPQQGYTGTKKDTVGVGTYNPHHSFGHKSVAVDWTTSRSHRPMNQTVDKKKLAPGPGAYNPEYAMPGRDQTSKLSSAFKSAVKRETKQAEVTPGPGYYDSRSTLNVTQPGQNMYQFFGSKAQRTSPGATQSVPGPGTYDAPSAFKAQEDFVDPSDPNQSAAPFTSTDARFHTSVQKSPGPGNYNAYASMAHDLSKKVFGRNTSFASTQKRFQKPEVNQLNVPGPGSYIEKKLVVPIRSHAVFASDTSRFGGKLNANAPGPASYELDKGMSTSANQPYAPSAATAFKSGTIREERKKNFVVPPVGNYNLDNSSSALESTKFKTPSSVFTSSNARFKQTTIPTPAPGDYGTDHSESQMNTKSYNITVA